MTAEVRYLNIPYLHKGRDFNGADCFGLLRLFYEHELGIMVPDFTEDYSDQWYLRHDYFRSLHKEYGFIEVNDFRYGDVVLFYSTTHSVGHVGILLEDNYFMHMAKVGCCINNLQMTPWRQRVHSTYRHLEAGIK